MLVNQNNELQNNKVTSLQALRDNPVAAYDPDHPPLLRGELPISHWRHYILANSNNWPTPLVRIYQYEFKIAIHFVREP